MDFTEDELEKEVNFLSMYSSWKRMSAEAYTTQLQPANIELQHVSRQSLFFQFLTDSCIDIETNLDLFSLLDSIKRGPFRFHKTVQGTFNDIMASWILNFIMHPKKSAEIVHNFFSIPNVNMRLFGMITFPSLFYHFITYQFQESAYEFLNALFDNAVDFTLFEHCLYSFIASSEFATIIWNNVFSQKNVSNANYFNGLLCGIRQGIPSLTSFQQNIFCRYAKAQPASFVSFFCGRFLRCSYFSVISTQNTQPDNHPIFLLLNYISSHPHSPHAKRILSSLTYKQSRYIFSHQATFFEGSTPLCLSLHEFYLFQCIVNSSPDSFPVKCISSIALTDSVVGNLESVYLMLPAHQITSSKKLPTPISLFPGINSFTKWKLEEDPVLERSYKKYCEMKTDYNFRFHQISHFNTQEFHHYMLIRTGMEYTQINSELDTLLLKLQTLSFYRSEIQNRQKKTWFALHFLAGSLITENYRMPPPSKFSSGIIPNEFTKSLAVVHQLGCIDNSFVKNGNNSRNVKKLSMLVVSQNIPTSGSTNKVLLRKANRRRRNSAEGDKSLSIHKLKLSIDEVTDKIKSNELKLLVWTRKLDNWVGDDRTAQLLSKQYHELIGMKRLNHEKVLEKRYEKCSRMIAKLLDSMTTLKRGILMIVMGEIGDLLQQVVQYYEVVQNPVSSWRLLEQALILTKNDLFFDNFLLVERMFFAFPDLRQILSVRMFTSMQYLETTFWKFLKELDPAFAEKCNDTRQYLQP